MTLSRERNINFGCKALEFAQFGLPLSPIVSLSQTSFLLSSDPPKSSLAAFVCACDILIDLIFIYLFVFIDGFNILLSLH